MSQHVCLVTPAHLSTNPRLVKEADALVAEGYEVTVVCGSFSSWAAEADREFADRRWKTIKIPYGPLAPKWTYVRQGVRRRLAVLGHKLSGHFAQLAFHPAMNELDTAVCRIKADLFIAHNLAALPLAAKAARKHGSKLGFDAEDFHTAEAEDGPENALRLHLNRVLEDKYLARCDYITAASPGIARAYSEQYRIPEPTVVLNVFPLADRPASSSNCGHCVTSGSLYWFSQTIGPDRGLENVIKGIARSRMKPHLYLRGVPVLGYEKQLANLAGSLGVQDRLHFLPLGNSAEMVRLAARFDVGLASELRTPRNRDICLTNKIFTYLLAGIPALASETTAQAEIARDAGSAVPIYPQDDPVALAREIDRLFASDKILATAKREAAKLGSERYNWDAEQKFFLDVIRRVLSS